ncbi:MAG: amidohydrolase family protein [Chloroflexota bacterium]
MDNQLTNPAIIDCDLHNVVPSFETLRPYLPVHWQELASQSDFKGPPLGNQFTAGGPITQKIDPYPEDGRPAGSDLSLLQAQVLDPLGVEYGILTCAYAIEGMRNPFGAAAFASAINDWQITEWLEPEPRLRASLVIPTQDPELAAQEIERLGDHPGFVQVFFPVRTAVPYGNRQYHPIYKAAIEKDLAIGIHFGGEPGAPPSASGWPSYYIEEYAGMPHIFQSHIISMIIEGVFVEFPELRVALIASGFTWLPSLMWRLDKEWKGLRREVPWVKNLPSDYMRQHLRMTLQPVDGPPDPAHLTQVIEQIGSDDMLMFSTDYPYAHFDSPAEAIPAGIPPNLKPKILSENARAFYHL